MYLYKNSRSKRTLVTTLAQSCPPSSCITGIIPEIAANIELGQRMDPHRNQATNHRSLISGRRVVIHGGTFAQYNTSHERKRGLP